MYAYSYVSKKYQFCERVALIKWYFWLLQPVFVVGLVYKRRFFLLMETLCVKLIKILLYRMRKKELSQGILCTYISEIWNCIAVLCLLCLRIHLQLTLLKIFALRIFTVWRFANHEFEMTFVAFRQHWISCLIFRYVMTAHARNWLNNLAIPVFLYTTFIFHIKNRMGFKNFGTVH